MSELLLVLIVVATALIGLGLWLAHVQTGERYGVGATATLAIQTGGW